MSGGSKQQFKQFSINSTQDACLALGMLISGVVINLGKYKEYASEAEALLEKRTANMFKPKSMRTLTTGSFFGKERY